MSFALQQVHGGNTLLCRGYPSRLRVAGAGRLSRLGGIHNVFLHATSIASTRHYEEGYGDDDEEDDDIDAIDESRLDNDWLEADLFLQSILDATPTPDLTAELVARIVVRSLQFVDYPIVNAGLERCFDFLTYDCRKAVTGRQGASTVERFVEYGLHSPALQPFMGAKLINLPDTSSVSTSAAAASADTANTGGTLTSTFTPAHPPFRGALLSVPIEIVGSDLWSIVQSPSGMVRPGGISTQSLVTRMIVRLEQQRERPPLASCWLVKEILNARYAFAGDMGNDIPE